ncbi:MAG: PHP domain-containing protein [Actinomycetota bacterium]|nr:PHP domain-containing protein [Actinomycetota bacterium]
MTLTNRELGELLAREAEREEGHRHRALRRASRASMFWVEEVAAMVEAGRSPTELPSVGPWVARLLHEWLDSSPAVEIDPLRHDFLTMTEVTATLDEHPEWRAELRGDLQVHSTWSDGKAPLADMVAEAATYGYEYVAATDHSKGLRIANGMDESELAGQAGEVAALNAGPGIRVLHGLEMNLSPEGEGDMDPGALARLDLVLGAFHSKLRVTEDQTERYLAALRNPTVHVLAHPRGRKYGLRMGLRADWVRVMEEAAARGTALEIDAYPDRQDLNVELLEVARQTEVTISLGTDAHAPWELGVMPFGLAAAIRAGIPRDRILNFMPYDDLLAWARR